MRAGVKHHQRVHGNQADPLRDHQRIQARAGTATEYSPFYLGSIYVDSQEGEVKSNLLELFRYLNKEESEYTYKIIKDFAEREKTKYLGSNLVDFMNDLTRERRKRLFNE